MRHKQWLIALALVMVGILLIRIDVNAIPSGALISFNSSSIKQATPPENRTDQKGTINTLRINSLQQNTNWKAYVGNVTGSLTLDDTNDYTIYDWTLLTFTGKVFASRANSITWSKIECITPENLSSEQSALGISGSEKDSIQNTFNWSAHSSFDIGSTTLSGCNSTTTYVNDTSQGQVNTAHFQEILLTDLSSLIYTTLFNGTKDGYRNDSRYDFQMMVADNRSSGSPPLIYFFYVELI